MTGAVFIDFRKAFDSIDHQLLLNKLSALGIENQEYAGFESYLHQRTQSVGYQGVFSEPEFITTGVPQAQFLAQCYLLCMLMTWQMLYVTAAY